eukprot:26906-Chlamydomonas_euryale.AAC.1
MPCSKGHTASLQAGVTPRQLTGNELVTFAADSLNGRRAGGLTIPAAARPRPGGCEARRRRAGTEGRGRACPSGATGDALVAGVGGVGGRLVGAAAQKKSLPAAPQARRQHAALI